MVVGYTADRHERVREQMVAEMLVWPCMVAKSDDRQRPSWCSCTPRAHLGCACESTFVHLTASQKLKASRPGASPCQPCHVLSVLADMHLPAHMA